MGDIDKVYSKLVKKTKNNIHKENIEAGAE